MKQKKSSITRIYHYEINEEGELIFEGKPLLDEKTIGFFLKHLKPIEESDKDALHLNGEKKKPQYTVYCQGEKNLITCLDVPLVTTSLELKRSDEGHLVSITLLFRGGVKELLDPNTLYVGPQHILYFVAMNGQITGRFSRKCYIEMAQFISEDQGTYHIEINKKNYPISSIPPFKKPL
jgi:hypothetical protein